MDKVREQAMLALYAVEKNGAYSNMALKEIFEKNRNMNARDKAFVTTLVYGTLKRLVTIDYIIEGYSSVRPKKISPYILTILRMGVYQIAFMDRVPENAAVNESVNLAKRYGHRASAGFVNGILRNFVRNGFKYPEEENKRMQVEYSFPEWICKMWCDDFGEDFARDLMQALNEDAEMSLRVNTLKTTREEVLRELNGAGRDGIFDYAIFSKGFDLSGSQIYRNGFVTAQDTSAMAASEVLRPRPGDRVLDICAAPGTKTTHIVQLMENRGEVTACDIHEHKLELIRRNAERMGANIIRTVCLDASKPIAEWSKSFDRVLADVPCSGLGIIRRKPDIKMKKETGLSELQYKILECAADYVKPGGELVYSTCTINRRENEDIIEKFLKKNKSFESVDITPLLPEALRKKDAEKGYVTFFPNVDTTDGFFIAKIKRGTDD